MIGLILLLVSTSITNYMDCFVEEVRTITGTVLTEYKDPLLFCDIYAYDIENKLLNDTITNLDGQFTITVPTSCFWIEAVYTGMETTRIEVAEESYYVIIMKEGTVPYGSVIACYKLSETIDIATSADMTTIEKLNELIIRLFTKMWAGFRSPKPN